VLFSVLGMSLLCILLLFGQHLWEQSARQEGIGGVSTCEEAAERGVWET